MSAERDLWASVLYQAICDMGTSWHPEDGENAARWIGERPHSDFREVCALAGLEANAVHSRLAPLAAMRPEERRARVAEIKKVARHWASRTEDEW